MTIPHKHEEVIKAWAEGYEIEAFNPEWGKWVSVPEPGWFNDIEYRVKPGVIEKPKTVYEEYVVRVDQDPFDEDRIDLIDECKEYKHYNLKLLFKDGELVQADVMKHVDDEDDLPW